MATEPDDFYPFESSDVAETPPAPPAPPAPAPYAGRSTSRGRSKAGPLGANRDDVDVAECDNRRVIRGRP